MSPFDDIGSTSLRSRGVDPACVSTAIANALRR
jgi:hypothetical protein